jgi:hypothetical protein
MVQLLLSALERSVAFRLGSPQNEGGCVGGKTVLVSDISGDAIEDGKGAVVRVVFNDARKGARVLDVTDAEAEKLGGRSIKRRGRPRRQTSDG